MDDHYETLGVNRDATQDEIKRAYHKMAHKYHPDKAGGDEEKFKKVNAAYQVLGDQGKKKQYDQFGQTFDEGQQGFGQGMGGFNINFEDLGGIGSIFDQFFSGGGGQREGVGVRRGDDIQIDVRITFQESAVGTKKEVKHRLYQLCTRCKGNRAEPGTPIKTCGDCGGSGTKERTQQTMLGMVRRAVVCSRCEGEGKLSETKCKQCQGNGRVKSDRTLTVDIPAGINDSQTIRISGKGEAPHGGGQPGDLYVVVHVEPHGKMKRSGNDVVVDIKVPFVDAVLGTEVEIDTLQGKDKILVPAGTQHGDVLRKEGLGFPALRGGGRGDHKTVIQIEVPKKITRRQKKILEEYRTEGSRRNFFGS